MPSYPLGRGPGSDGFPSLSRGSRGGAWWYALASLTAGNRTAHWAQNQAARTASETGCLFFRRGVYKTPSLLYSAPSARFGSAHGLHSGERQIVALRFVYRSIAPRFFVCRSIVLHFACRSIAVSFAYRSRFTATADFHLPFPFYPPKAGLYCMPSWSFRLMAIHRLPDKRYSAGPLIFRCAFITPRNRECIRLPAFSGLRPLDNRVGRRHRIRVRNAQMNDNILSEPQPLPRPLG